MPKKQTRRKKPVTKKQLVFTTQKQKQTLSIAQLLDHWNRIKGIACGSEAKLTPQVEQAKVAQLRTKRAGRVQVLLIEVDKPFLVGRNYKCDYVVPDPRVSDRHFHLYAHRSDTGEVLVSCEDRSHNGLIWNGIPIKGDPLILCHGDTLQIPGSQTFKFLQLTELRCLADAPRLEVKRHTLGDYERLDKVLGTGTFGQVYLAYDKVKKKQVACKRQSRRHFQDQVPGEALQREVSILRKLSHPSICAVYDVIEEADCINIMLELVCGGDMFSYIERKGHLCDADAKFICYQLVQALKYLHSRGFAHRDIKGENVLLRSGHGPTPRVLLTDFGLAFDANDEEFGKRGAMISNQPLGTLSYLSPEALRARVPGFVYDPTKLDAWGLGVVLFLMLYGWHPFENYAMDTTRGATSLVYHQLVKDGELGPSSDPGLALRFERTHSNDACAELVRRILHAELVFNLDQASLLQVNPAALHIIKGLLQANPVQRFTMGRVEKCAWIKDDISKLKQLYKRS